MPWIKIKDIFWFSFCIKFCQNYWRNFNYLLKRERPVIEQSWKGIKAQVFKNMTLRTKNFSDDFPDDKISPLAANPPNLLCFWVRQLPVHTSSELPKVRTQSSRGGRLDKSARTKGRASDPAPSRTSLVTRASELRTDLAAKTRGRTPLKEVSKIGDNPHCGPQH